MNIRIEIILCVICLTVTFNMEKLYKITDTISLTKKQVFLLVTIILVLISLFSKINVNSGLFIGIIIIFVLVSYLSNIFILEQNENKKIHQIKQSSIYPKTEIITKYDDVTTFLFDIQDMYIINPQSYEELVALIDEFLILYQDGINFPSNIGININMVQNIVTQAMNTMHTFVYNVSSPVLTNKIHMSSLRLNKILNKYILKMYEIYKIQLNNNEINKNTKLVNLSDPHPYVKSSIINEHFEYYV